MLLICLDHFTLNIYSWQTEQTKISLQIILATSRIFWSKIHIFSSHISKDSPFSCDHFNGKVVVEGWPEAEKGRKNTPKISKNYNSFVTKMWILSQNFFKSPMEISKNIFDWVFDKILIWKIENRKWTSQWLKTLKLKKHRFNQKLQ